MDQTALLGLASILIGAILAYILFRGDSSSRNPKQSEKVEKPAPKAMSRAEVAQHNKEDDFWLIIEDRRDPSKLNVYDLTQYADQHPGGDIIYKNAGGDASEGFKGPQHPPTVWDLIAEYHIGWIEE